MGTVRLQKGIGQDGSDQITIDEVRYQSSAPWPATTGGSSLTRNGALDFGNFPSSWNAASPTPGGILQTENYQTWATSNNVGSEELDPDGDFLSNLLEFAIGTDPNSPDELPSFVRVGEEGTVRFTSHIGRSGVTLEFQTSNDLETWSTRETTVTDLSGSIQTKEFAIDLSETPKTFWRLRALATQP
ncbi:hypothetical protein N9Z23_01960 [Akkermansiaceae bacterium]|nr:hypothetical protein [Akkermansiaceae bacterium]